MAEQDFSGRAAIITGGTRGIGLGIAAELVSRGASVCITARKPDELDAAVAELDPDGSGRAIAARGSADDAEHQRAAIDATLRSFGRVDYLVNNAAVNPVFGPMMDYELAAVRKIFEVNVVAALAWTQLAWRSWLKDHGGAVLNVASVGGIRTGPFLGAYNREQGGTDPHDPTARTGAQPRGPGERHRTRGRQDEVRAGLVREGRGRRRCSLSAAATRRADGHGEARCLSALRRRIVDHWTDRRDRRRHLERRRRLMTDRVALVTGSTSGIGKAVVERFVADGLKVVINSAKSVDAGQAMVAELGEDRTLYVQGDISEAGTAQRLLDATIARFGRLDVLVNNAGTTVRIAHEDFATATPDVFRRLYDVNVVGTWQMSVAAAPHLKETGAGCIVNVTSLAGVRPLGSSIPYAVSKAAMNHLTLLMANVLAPDVRVNAVAPGLVDTPWTADWTDLHEGIKFMAPMQRAAVPDDVAEVVATLIDSTYVTGQVWVLDGGLSLR
jgi:ketoreductase RED2